MKNIYLLLFIAASSTLFGQAKIEFDTTSYDLGEVEGDIVIRKEIWFTNTGTEPVIIIKVTTGDGGSTASYPKEPIAPGARAKVIFIQSTKHRRGKFHRHLMIRYNSGLTSSVQIRGVIATKKDD